MHGDVEGILQPTIVPKKKKVRPHVTWDEEQIAEHDKTRGQKMKIDEPLTPYVTDEEFKKLCEEDSDYQRDLAEDRSEEDGDVQMIVGKNLELNSVEANNDSAMDCMSAGADFDLGKLNAGLNSNKMILIEGEK